MIFSPLKLYTSVIAIVGIIGFANCYAEKRLTIQEINSLLERTISIGFSLSNSQKANIEFIKTVGLRRISNAGFTAIRIPVNFVNAMPYDSSNYFDVEWLNEVDQIINAALQLKLAVIIDNHEDEQLMNRPQVYRARFLNLWTQLSRHYSHFSQEVVFELMAEPHSNLEAVWNDYLNDALTIVRKDNPDRGVIIGPGMFNRPEALETLSLPIADRYIIVTFHQYSPVKFTMQGEAWFPFGKPMDWIGTKWPGIDDEVNVSRLFDQVACWASKIERPVFLGEFGVSSNADQQSGFNFIKFNREQAEKRHFSWGYWSCFAVNFNLFDEQAGAWKSNYLNALMPGSPEQKMQYPTVKIIPATGITAKNILIRHNTAIGGQKNIEKVKDLQLEGTATLGGQSLGLHELYVLPDALQETITINGKAFQQTLVKPGRWSVKTQDNDQQLKDYDKEYLDERKHFFLENYLLTNDLYKITVAGKVSCDGTDCHLVSVLSPLGRHFQIYYQINTGLRYRIVFLPPLGEAAPTLVITYKDYRITNGLLLPTRVIVDLNDTRIDAQYSEIIFNNGIELSEIN